MALGRVFETVVRAMSGALMLFALTPVAGCYSTTPHRAVTAAWVAPARCADAIDRVFARSGFVQLPTPPNLSRFYAPRTSGSYSSFLRSGAGVGVTIDAPSDGDGTCHVTFEALSPDVGSPSPYPSSCISQGQPQTRIVTVGGVAPDYAPPCPIVPSSMGSVSYAPGAENDAAVDELARRLRAELSPPARVE